MNDDTSILLTHLNDARGVRAVRSLVEGRLLPREVVVADGGSRREVLAEYEALAKELPFGLRILHVPGTVADSREKAWASCHGPVIAFLDADEAADATWLESLTRPLRRGDADFTAGPTVGWSDVNAWDRYHGELDRWFYRTWVANDIAFAPMGNSAWRRQVFEALARADQHVFDVRLGRGAEDFDVNVRALKAGFRGLYVPEAVLRHDHSSLRGMRRALRKKYSYALGEFQVRRRHAKFLDRRPTPQAPGGKPWHPIALLEPFARRWARFRSRHEP